MPISEGRFHLRSVKVIVSGMRYFGKRLGEGGLDQVPVKWGWVKERTPEKQLKPFPI
ncbi:hypothetical protein [Laspinema palackyanum]|uniref:hypothetical protein n=1 Tax=Laspinema palackyanum TaxID=3231601 RepID=UPI00349F9715